MENPRFRYKNNYFRLEIIQNRVLTSITNKLSFYSDYYKLIEEIARSNLKYFSFQALFCPALTFTSETRFQENCNSKFNIKSFDVKHTCSTLLLLPILGQIFPKKAYIR